MSGTIETGSHKINGVPTDYNYPDAVGDVETFTSMDVDSQQKDYYVGKAPGVLHPRIHKVNGVPEIYWETVNSGFGSNMYPEFIFTIDTEILTGIGSLSRNFSIPILSSGQYVVDWGDGTVNAEKNHEYATGGVYEVKMWGPVRDWSFLEADSFDADKIIDVSKVEGLAFVRVGMFNACTNLTWSATDEPCDITVLVFAFQNCSVFNSNINHWDISKVDSLFGTFASASTYDQPLDRWDTSNVTTMLGLFSSASSFNQFLPWDTSNVENFGNMFGSAASYNQPVDQFNVSKATNMFEMFRSASLFDQPMPSWSTGNVTSMGGMFAGTLFNQDISHFDTSKVTDMTEMFDTVPTFSQDISTWNVGQVTLMTGMLNGSGLTTTQYSDWLINLDSQPLQPDIPLGAAGLTYNAAGASARANLVGPPKLMTITGDSPV